MSAGARLRIDDIDLCLRRAGTGRLGVIPDGNVTAAAPVVLPAFLGWIQGGALELTLRGRATEAVEHGLDVSGAAHGTPLRVTPRSTPASQDDGGAGEFDATLSAPLAALRSALGQPLSLGVLVWT